MKSQQIQNKLKKLKYLKKNQKIFFIKIANLNKSQINPRKHGKNPNTHNIFFLIKNIKNIKKSFFL